MYAVPSMAVFSISFMLRFPGTLLRYFLDDFKICLCYYWYHFCFCIPHALNYNCKVLVFHNHYVLFLDHISVPRNCNMYFKTHVPFSLLQYMTSDLLFETVPSVSLAISTIHFMTYFFCFGYMLISVFTVSFYPCFLSYFNCR
jgi:hypothetical protein